jgi:hypothetical protein
MTEATTYEDELSSSFETVLREADALYEGRGRLQQTYDRLAARLRDLGLAHALVGGFALIRHGVRRFTEDVDILVSDADLEPLWDALIGRGYTRVAGTDRSIRDAETRVRIDFVVSGEFPGDGQPKPVAFPDPAEAAVEDGPVRVVALATLIELKLASGMSAPGRLQDLADVQRLIAVHGLDPTYAETLNSFVR